MPYVTPRALNFLGSLAAVPTKWMNTPPEGPMVIPAEIIWGDYSQTNCVVLNVSNYSNLKFSQAVALVVDNSDCGCDVRYSFRDTQTTVTVPAYEPYAVIPIFTNAVEVYVQTGLNGQVVEPTDITRFQIHNTMPPPVTVPTSLEQNNAAVGGIDMATASTPLIDVGKNGTLENLFLALAMNAANSGNGTWQTVDGTGKVIAQGSLSVSAGNKVNLTLCNLTGIRVRFTNGVNILCTETAVLGASIDANAYYRTP